LSNLQLWSALILKDIADGKIQDPDNRLTPIMSRVADRAERLVSSNQELNLEIGAALEGEETKLPTLARKATAKTDQYERDARKLFQWLEPLFTPKARGLAPLFLTRPEGRDLDGLVRLF